MAGLGQGCEEVGVLDLRHGGGVLGEEDVRGRGVALLDELGGELEVLAVAQLDVDAGLLGERRRQLLDQLLVLGVVDHDRRAVVAAPGEDGRQQQGGQGGGDACAVHRDLPRWRRRATGLGLANHTRRVRGAAAPGRVTSATQPGSPLPSRTVGGASGPVPGHEVPGEPVSSAGGELPSDTCDRSRRSHPRRLRQVRCRAAGAGCALPSLWSDPGPDRERRSARIARDLRPPWCGAPRRQGVARARSGGCARAPPRRSAAPGGARPCRGGVPGGPGRGPWAPRWGRTAGRRPAPDGWPRATGR